MKRKAVAAVAVTALLVGGVVGSQAFPREVVTTSDQPTPCVRAVWRMGQEVTNSLRRAGVSVDPPGVSIEPGPLTRLQAAKQMRGVYARVARSCITQNYPREG